MMLVYLQWNNLKKFSTWCTHFVKLKKPVMNVTNIQNVEMHQQEYVVIVDQQLRDKSTTIV